MTGHEKKWLKIAEAFHTPFEERTPHQIKVTKHGLCRAADLKGKGTSETDMVRVTVSELGGNKYWITPRFKYDTDMKQQPGFRNANDTLRGDLALSIANLPRKEFILNL